MSHFSPQSLPNASWGCRKTLSLEIAKPLVSQSTRWEIGLCRNFARKCTQ